MLRGVHPDPVWLVAGPIGESYIRLIRPSEGAVKREVRVEANPESPAWKSESEPGKKQKWNLHRRSELLPL